MFNKISTLSTVFLFLFISECYSNDIRPLTPAEQDYYELSFSYAMATLKEGESYPWKTYSASGSITAGKAFTSNQGTTCRPYSETFVVQDHKGTSKGYGCARIGREGWCKLKEGNMLSCALEPPSNALEGAMRSGGEAIDRGSVPVRSFLHKWSPF